MTQLLKLNARALRAAVLFLALAYAGEARSNTPPVAAVKKPKAVAPPIAAPPPVTIATVGTRKIDDLDIRSAAASLEADPLRKKDPPAWRRMLLDLCVDRELLSMEAERRELQKDPDLQAEISNREYLILLREIYKRVLVPGLTPTPEQLRDIRAAGLHRGVDLYYIIVRDNAAGENRRLAQRVYEKAKAGARFDSLARIYSGHPPSHAAGGHYGWVLARDLDPASYEAMRTAKVGDVLGLYSGPYGHEIYKIGAFQELSDDSLYNLIYFERKRGIASDYEKMLLSKYHFVLDSTQVMPLTFTTASEPPDSILASLGPDGTRPAQGVRPAVGILARSDAGPITFPEIIRATPPVLGNGGRMRIRDTEALYNLCARAALHQLTVMDARSRGIDKDPPIARELKLSRDEILTLALVGRSLPPAPDSTSLHGLVDADRERYRRPRATMARVAMFAEAESAKQALVDWARAGITDSSLTARQMRVQPGATPTTLMVGRYATLELPDGAADALTHAVTTLSQGQFAPAIRMERGWAAAQVLSVEEERALNFDEASLQALRDWRDEAEAKWVTTELQRLRAKTPARMNPGRLEAVKLTRATTSEETTP